MGKKKHQFINKNKAHKFNVVYRSQRDPLQPDEDSSQHVLVPAGGLSEDGAGPSSNNEEKIKFGIYYNDDYDYMQHLKPRGEGMCIMAEDPAVEDGGPLEKTFGNLHLPTEVLPSKYEEDIGMLNKGVLPRGPQPDWDPDIVAALDDGVDFDDPDNMIDDNFITMANADNDIDAGNSRLDDDNDKDRNDEDDYETESDVSSNGCFNPNNLSDDDFSDSEEETKSRFTNYSMTSSINHRTEGLKLLDDRFERIMEEYDEEEIGSIDHEETTGIFDVKNELISQVVDEFIDQQKAIQLSETVNEEDDNVVNDDGDSDENMYNDKKLFEQFEKKPSEKWDCESIISTYSNIYNHPKLIEEPKMINLHKRTGIPLGVFNENKQNSDSKDCDIEMNFDELVTLNNTRKKDETPDEKKARKQEVKDHRRNRRKEKKDNKNVFKDEHRKQEMEAINRLTQLGMKI